MGLWKSVARQAELRFVNNEDEGGGATYAWKVFSPDKKAKLMDCYFELA